MGPFIMNPEGVGRIFAPLAAFTDGPFPEHYEPMESPVANPLHPQQSNSPVAKKYKSDADKYGTVEQGFNIVCTTRSEEHTSELQSLAYLVCRLLLEKKKKNKTPSTAWRRRAMI